MGQLIRRETATQLRRLDGLRQALEKARTFGDVKKVHDVAAALKAFFQKERGEQGEKAARLNECGEVILRSMRRGGDMLIRARANGERVKRGGDRRSKGQADPLIRPPTLKELGVHPMESKRWQAAARVDEKTFESFLKNAEPGALTPAGFFEEVVGRARRQERIDRVAALAKNAVVPIGEVRPAPVIYADPPWQYENTVSAGAVSEQYPTMSLEEICALKVPATETAVAFLWVSVPLLPEGLRVLEAWGFEYKTCLVWDKSSGAGNWVLVGHELLLLGARGDMPCPQPENRPPSVLQAPRGAHSEKPDEFAALIERMYPTLPRLEMFARKPRPGWVVWGNQV